MASVTLHLSIEELRERYASCSDARIARHFQTIWLLAKGYSIAEVSEMTSFGTRWIEQLLARYNAGWHGEAGLNLPEGMRLVFLPPYSPELQPAETLWALVDEPIVNQHVETIEQLDEIIARQCVARAAQRDTIRTRTDFQWWPKQNTPN